MEKKNVKKEVINNEVKTQNTTSQVKEVKKTPVTEIKAKVLKTTQKAKKETPKETPETTKAKVTKEVEAQQKANLIEGVVAHREIKYIYPDDVTDTLARKKWRQQVRNKLKDLERAYLRIQNENTKESQEAKKALEEYQSKVLKQGVQIA